jgi:uncharacterized damage-inducible protein DinB
MWEHTDLTTGGGRHAGDGSTRLRVESTIAGDPWYGAPLLSILDGIDAKDAAWRPPGGVHSVWELTLHITVWARETARRLRGGPSGEPAEGDWPAVTATDAASWKAAIADTRRAHGELAQALADLDDRDLDRQVGGNQVDGQGKPVTFHRTVVGVLQHDAYHAGQIALVKKLRAADPRRPG